MRNRGAAAASLPCACAALPRRGVRRRSAARGPRWRPGARRAGLGRPRDAGRGTRGRRCCCCSAGSAPRPPAPRAASCCSVPGSAPRVSAPGPGGPGRRPAGLYPRPCPFLRPARPSRRPLSLLSRRDETRCRRRRRRLPQQRGPRQGGLLPGAGGAPHRHAEGDQEGVLPGASGPAGPRPRGQRQEPGNESIPVTGTAADKGRRQWESSAHGLGDRFQSMICLCCRRLSPSRRIWDC